MSSTDNIGTRTAARRRRGQPSTSILENIGGGGALNSSRNNGRNNGGAGVVLGQVMVDLTVQLLLMPMVVEVAGGRVQHHLHLVVPLIPDVVP